MNKNGVSKLLCVADSTNYVDKHGKTWFSFECIFEDGMAMSTRRPTDSIELVVGDNIHYSVKFDNVYGKSGTTRKVDDDVVINKPYEVGDQLDNIEFEAQACRTDVSIMGDYLRTILDNQKMLNGKLDKIQEALNYIAKEVN